MVNHSPSHQPRGFADHKDTYDGFLTGTVAVSMICGFIVVALCAFRFMDSWNVFTGFAGLVLGIVAVLIDVRSSGKWYVSGALLALFGLYVAINL
jgi:hypothetical protein